MPRSYPRIERTGEMTVQLKVGAYLFLDFSLYCLPYAWKHVPREAGSRLWEAAACHYRPLSIPPTKASPLLSADAPTSLSPGSLVTKMLTHRWTEVAVHKESHLDSWPASSSIRTSSAWSSVPTVWSSVPTHSLELSTPTERGPQYPQCGAQYPTERGAQYPHTAWNSVPTQHRSQYPHLMELSAPTQRGADYPCTVL